MNLVRTELSPQTQLVLLRHGESEWNAQSRFAGWADIDLTDVGVEQARRAARTMTACGWKFDCGFSSYLTRALRTYWIVAREMRHTWTTLVEDWRLNERHYGMLTGVSKSDALDEYGCEEFERLRFRFYARPAALLCSADRSPEIDIRYSHIDLELLPRAESIADTAERVDAVWVESILPMLREGRRILVCAHGTSLRTLVRRIEGIPNEMVSQLDMPNAFPVSYSRA